MPFAVISTSNNVPSLRRCFVSILEDISNAARMAWIKDAKGYLKFFDQVGEDYTIAYFHGIIEKS